MVLRGDFLKENMFPEDQNQSKKFFLSAKISLPKNQVLSILTTQKIRLGLKTSHKRNWEFF